MIKLKIGDLTYNCSFFQSKKVIERQGLQLYYEFILDGQYDINEDENKNKLNKSQNKVIINNNGLIITENFENLWYLYYDNFQNLLTFKFFQKED